MGKRTRKGTAPLTTNACPIFPGKRYRDWTVDDPAGRSVEDIRPIRDEIERRVRGLLAELDVTIAA